MLLMSLDTRAAGELLRAVDPALMLDLAAEVAYLKATMPDAEEALAQAGREFLSTLTGRKSDFLRSLLETAVGQEKSLPLLQQVNQVLETRDPFMNIRNAPVESLAAALESESPQVAAIVLSEMTPARSAQLLPRLPEAVRVAAIADMTSDGQLLPQAKAKIGATIRARLASQAAAAGQTGGVSASQRRTEQLRKVAILLRGLDKQFRETITAAIKQRDENAATAVLKLMITWDDVPVIADMPLQQVLREVDSRKLALALVKAAPATIKKVRSNISERAAAMLDEETSLLSSTKAADIEKAREEILEYLRDMNANGALSFVEDQ